MKAVFNASSFALVDNTNFKLNATAGTVNLGGGGGGATSHSSTGGAKSGAAGGSGIVIIAYSNTYAPLTIGAGLTYTEPSRSGYRVYRFIAGTGSINW